MKTFKNYLSKTWVWIYERTALWIILLLGFGFMNSLNSLSIDSTKTKKGNADCKTQCHPVSYEYIKNNKIDQCWCYKDVSTLVPAKR